MNDPLYDDATQLAERFGWVSVSMVQRHLGLGYTRASQIVESMERQGLIGRPDGSVRRNVLRSAPILPQPESNQEQKWPPGTPGGHN